MCNFIHFRRKSVRTTFSLKNVYVDVVTVATAKSKLNFRVCAAAILDVHYTVSNFDTVKKIHNIMECCVRTVFFYIFFSVQKNITHAVFKHKTISQIFFHVFVFQQRSEYFQTCI